MALTRVLFLVRLCLLALILTVWAGHAAAQDADGSTEQAFVVTTLDTPDPDELRKAFRRMKRADGLQWELRTDLPEERQRRTPRWLRAIGSAIVDFIVAIMPILKVLFWVGIAGLAGLLLYAIFNALRGVSFERQEAEADIVPEYRPSARMARILLEEADALAAEGRYAEAVHLLLRRSIQDIEQARPTAVRLSLTSREIASSPVLGAQTRATFSQLARTVERSHFGGQPVNTEDYARARRTYEDFAQAGRPADTGPLPSLLDGKPA